MKYNINKFNLQFDDKNLEKEYVDFHLTSTFKHAKMAIVLGLVMFYLFSFVDGQIVQGLKFENNTKTTIIEQTLKDNLILNNKIADVVKTPFETILRQNNQFVNELENNIWKIRFNALIIGIILFSLTYIKSFKTKIEYIASLVGIIGSVAVSLMISYVSGSASYIYLSGLILIMTWLALLARIRFKIVLFSMLIIIALNNIITSNQFIENVLYQGKELVGGIVMKGQLSINLPINNFFLLSTMVLLLVSAYILEQYARSNFIKNKENEELLLNILPKSIAEIKKQDENKIVADSFEKSTILFADLVGFTEFSSSRSPTEVVEMLNELYSKFDDATKKIGVEKIKTLGDGYMVASGVPLPNENHAEKALLMAIQMRQIVYDFNYEHNLNFKLRIGINSGAIVAGVVGKVKYAYDIWGDTVNIASRMESTGVPNEIQVSMSTYNELYGKYIFEDRGEIAVKGKGLMKTYLYKSEKL